MYIYYIFIYYMFIYIYIYIIYIIYIIIYIFYIYLYIYIYIYHISYHDQRRHDAHRVILGASAMARRAVENLRFGAYTPLAQRS